MTCNDVKLEKPVTLAVPPAVLALLLLAGPATAQCKEDCQVIHDLEGEVAGDQFGWVSNDIGDVDGDGIHEFVVTAPTNDANGFSSGRIYVYDGATGTELWHATGALNAYRLGNDAAGAGDVNGDGIPDVIVGAPNNGTGRAIVYSGDDGSVLHTFNGQNNGDQFGSRVWGGGDFNGDGTPDVIIGAPQHDTGGANAGRAYVYSGGNWALICTIDGLGAGHRLGSGVAFVGDVSQPPDGRDEIIVGAQNASSVGRAYVYRWNGLSCQLAYQVAPSGPAVDFGLWFMNGGGDVNGDGTPDFYVNDYAVNRAHIFSGVDGSLIWTLTGDGNGQFGIGRLIDDVDGDGRADIFLAAWISSVGAPQAGKAFVYSGRDASVLETFTHTVAGAGFGFDANGQGDMNGDGKYDYLVTAALDNANNGRGKTFVIAGSIAPVDFNGDHVINVDDLVTVILGWGACPDDGPCIGDANRDGQIDVDDLVAVIINWTG
ncbi:MAG: FG-GAP-like repeat-containing protein [Planctomycetota bacterium]|jgi:hypothetical protein